MSSKNVGIEQARKTLGDLVNQAQQGTDIILTRNGKPAARITRYQEDAMTTELTAGTRVIVDRDTLPTDWTAAGEITEVTEQTVIVELDNGQRQEVLHDQVSRTS
ncbi:type II toxin-antitoxin system Phd/YefM family antitoxin [Actinoplanes teichomyceticus]|uniref:Antitoxin n=1 Tax=Actinoplanes teichomyceticus TaxID=1867 RepID=A0A561WAR0_ACTTI|nr:type II toxin-antitoxin system prevent-host-death family antitoxin [Actinoplanes teichomyceticus]TWG20948.1 prevent-host-death family protein [Actinoplanes teichomyceticus]GIF16534.1 hypothetical protein Ate01nite_65660 [Actinoplanes teichomyceticus]